MKTLKRREFLQKGALVMAGAAAMASGVSVVAGADQWTAGLKTLNPHEGETLLKVARQIYPHRQLDDSYYIKVVQQLDSDAAKNAKNAKLLRQGVGRLDRIKHTQFVNLPVDDQIAALRQVDRSDFFEKVRSTELVTLYNDHDVWRILGYPGASYPIGGYLHHGFNDLNWLPEPPESASPKPA